MTRSKLHSRHQTLGAQFGMVGSWEMPIHYGDPVQEHLAVRKGVGIADLSHRGTIHITGEDRITWLQSIISNDILPLKPGLGLSSSFMNHKGKMLSYFRVYVLEEAVLLEDVGEIGDTTYQAFRKFLLYGTKAKMKGGLETCGILLVSGPGAEELVQTAFGVEASTLPLLGFATHQVGDQQALIARTEETGDLSIEILVPAEELLTVWDRLWEAGKPMGLVAFGTAARESLRIEAGLPRAGIDLTEEVVPPEANLEGKAYSLSKGCYPGQEVVARMDTYGSVKRRLVGLAIEGPNGLLLAKGMRLYSGDRDVGWISSSAFSPIRQQTIALGFPLRDFTQPKTELTIEVQGQRYRAIVQALPFSLTA